MRIKEITKQIRRDFWAILECEHCNATQSHCGYDDDYYHGNVIPRIKCLKCSKTANETYRPLKTKYHKDEIV